MERDEFDDVREQEREAERELRDVPYRDCGFPDFEDPRSSGHGMVRDSALERDLDPEAWPKGLEERAHKDAALLSKIRGLEPNVWTSASFEQRLETLREAERQLASFQGRVGSRTYAVKLPRFIEGQAGWLTPGPVYSGNPFAWNEHAEGRYIQISESWLGYTQPHKAVLVFAHESFRAYQDSVLWASEQGEAALELLRRYPEVDAKTLAGWHKWKDRSDERGDENLVEFHADRYGCIVVERLYPGYWASGW